MDEHVGLTPKVAQQILSKANLAQLLQAADTGPGTAQRVHNALVQFPDLLRSTALQRRIFELGEILVRMQRTWTEEEEQWRALAPTQLYPLALLMQILRLSSSFTPKQQVRLREWQASLDAKFGPDGFDEVQRRLRGLRDTFASQRPFAHLQLAPFTVPGLTHAQLQGRRDAPSVPGASAASVAEVPFAFLPRTKCPTCGRMQSFYCTHCYEVIHPLAKDKLPRVDIPLQIDIVLHENVLRSKSTALQLLLLAHPRALIAEHTFPAVPVFDPTSTAVLFPSERALTVQQLAEKLRSMSAAVPSSGGAASTSAAASACPVTSLRRIVFLEGTWAEAQRMADHPRLAPLVHVRLDFAAGAPLSDRVEGAEDGGTVSAPSSSTPPSTAFWRYQRFGPGALSSIEAVYHCLVQLDAHGLMPRVNDSGGAMPDTSSSTVAASSPSPSSHRFDNVLWLFAMAFERVRAHYTNHPSLLPPPSQGDGATDS